MSDILTRELGLRLLERMRMIRQFEERVMSIYPTDAMVTPVHLHIGQEAVPVGVCAHLRANDALFFGHRTHGPALAKGISMRELMAELYGRTMGCSGGYGGSMHLVDPDHGLLGSAAIVGGSVALGVGSGLAAKLLGEERIAVSYFGDGAVDSGVFWESLNFAALKQVPVLFVCENNGLSNVMRQADHLFVDIASAAELFMPTHCCDGTDVLDVYVAVERSVAIVRQTGGPAFVECRTKRWMKHQGVEPDDLPYNPIDRQADCPIRRLESVLFERELADQEDFRVMIDQIDACIDDAVEFAIQSPFPDVCSLTSEV